MRYQTLAAAAALAMGMSSAQAADTTFTMPVSPSPAYSSGTVSVSGSFTDYWRFEAPTDLVSGGALKIDILTLLDIDNIGISLWHDDTDDTLVANGSTGSVSSWVFNQAVTAGQDYFFKVTGDAVGAHGGSYIFTAVAAIPEPGTYTMLLAGLGVVGFIAFRRRQDD